MIEMRETEMRELIEAELDGVAGGRIPQAEGPRTRSDLLDGVGAGSALSLSWFGSRSPDFAISMMHLATAS
jgi:hypothetical protein